MLARPPQTGLSFTWQSHTRQNGCRLQQPQTVYCNIRGPLFLFFSSQQFDSSFRPRCRTSLPASTKKPAHFNEPAPPICEVYVYGSGHPVCSSYPSHLICLTFAGQWVERVQRSRYLTWVCAASIKNWDTLDSRQLWTAFTGSCTYRRFMQNQFQLAGMWFCTHEV